MNWKSFKFLALLPVVLAAGCGKELPGGEGQGEPAGVRLSVSLPQELSRTALGDKTGGKYPVFWQEGDCISLNGHSSLPLSSEDAGGMTAPFIFRDGLASPFNLLYPVTSEPDVVVFPHHQHYVQGSFDPAAAPMWGTSAAYEDVTLHHLSSLVRIALTSSEGVTVTGISLTALGGAPLSGTFRAVKDQAGAYDGSLQPLNTGSTIEYSFGEEGVRLGGSPLYAWIAIPYGTYGSGFKAVVKAAGGDVMLLSFFSEGRSVAPSKVLEFPAAEFTADGSGVLYIESADDLLSLGGASNAVLVGDIDMSGMPWTEIASYSGTLDGLGHTVYGLSGPMFNTVTGVVRNLVLASEYTETENRVSGGLVRTLGSSGVVENCVFTGRITYARRLESGSEDAFWGGLVGTASAQTTLRNCTNRGAVTVDGSYLVNPRLGGIVGRYQGGASRLVNEGSVIYGENSTAGALYLGGVAGVHNGSGTGTDLRNHGDVACYGTVTGSNLCFVGGVVGSHSSGHVADYVSTESGSVTVDTRKMTYAPKVGGVIGQLTITASTKGFNVTGSANGSPIYMVCNGKALDRNAAIGGLIGYISQSGTTADQTIAIDGCSHDAPITVQGLLSGKSTAATGRAVVGGLVALATPVLSGRSHTLEVRNSRNTGDIRFEGGVKYCYAGGIVADIQCVGANISGCENRGSILVEGEMDNYSSGGIAGLLLGGHVVTRCKNFCDITRGGLISGTSPVTAAASWCGVGGRLWDGESWNSPVESDFPKFMYAGWAPSDFASYPQYYTGCSRWDGSSKLSWED